MDQNFHEEFQSDLPVKDVSDRSFGLAGGIFFIAIGFLKAVFLSLGLGLFIMALGGCLTAAAFFAPHILSKPKAVMVKAAPHIARILNPVLMGIIFVICFIPGGLVMKILRRDLLNREYDPFASSYWTKRAKHDLPDPMKYQF